MMKAILVILSISVPALLLAQARAPRIKRTNPPTLSTPTGYTHIVEVTGPAKTVVPSIGAF